MWICEFRLFAFSRFDENTTISRFHDFTFSRFHDFTFSPHQSPETMLSPLISPLRQAESHELIIVHSLEETRLLDPMEQREERPSLLGLSRVVTEEDKVKPHLKTMERSDWVVSWGIKSEAVDNDVAIVESMDVR